MSFSSAAPTVEQYQGSQAGPQSNTERAIFIRPPNTDDGWPIHELIRSCPPLDLNSPYAYLLLATHFRDRCMVATDIDDNLLGFVSGYLQVKNPDTFFLWQVAVSDKARGEGLAGRLVEAVLKRKAQSGVRYLETTITPDNQASWRLFQSLARRWGAEFTSSEFFSEEQLGGEHNPEHLVRIGPFHSTGI